MVLVLFLAFFLFGCSLERNNPYDPHGINYNPDLYPSSSSLNQQGSSFAYCIIDGMCLDGPYTYNECFDNLRGYPSNSCTVPAPPSSSSIVPIGESSSSVAQGVSSFGMESSSSIAPSSSSSSAPPSSSSIAPSSSSALPSSSSVPSSSSLAPSSSSLAPSSNSLSHIGKGNNISNYRTVKIGDQTWMAENLDYVVEGSKCYNNDPARCNEYGSLYNWSTAMGLPSSCNSNFCSNQIQSPHRGICPSGWHIPSSEDWGKLSHYVDGTSGTDAGYSSATAGRLLKSTTGWNSYNGASGNGTDEFGFSALPGGYGNSDGSFSNVGNYGYWWSANEGEDGSYDAYLRYMIYGIDYASWDINDKSGLFSVRCVQD